MTSSKRSKYSVKRKLKNEASRFYISDKNTRPNQTIQNSVFYSRDIYNTFKKFENLVFLITVLFSGLSLSVVFSYLYIYADETMHPSKTMLSLFNVVSMASELLIYPLSSKLIKLVGGRIQHGHLSCRIAKYSRRFE